METDKKKVARVLDAISSSLRRLSDKDFEGIFNGTSDMRIEVVPRKAGATHISPIQTQRRLDYVQLTVQKLMSLESREDAESFIRKQNPNKEDLKSLCREVGVPFSTKDTNDSLISNLIEHTIGYKLRSDAIRKGGL